MSKFFVKVLWKYSICEGDKIYPKDKSHTLNWFKFVYTMQYNSEVDGQHTCKTLTFFAFCTKKTTCQIACLECVFAFVTLHSLLALFCIVLKKKKIPTCVCVWVLCISKTFKCLWGVTTKVSSKLRQVATKCSLC